MEKEIKIRKRIKALAEMRCKRMPEPLQTEALKMVNEIFKKDTGSNITLLPYRIIISSKKLKCPEKITISCGLISLYGWLAYSLYDRIIDQKETALKLPLANIFHREMIMLCQKIADPENSKIYQKMFDLMDCAELVECRNNLLPDRLIQVPLKQQTIHKSIGLAVPSVLALLHARIPPDGSDIKKFMDFFRNYILIKQLSDDLRDLKEDMQNRISTRVTTKIKMARKPGSVKIVLIEIANEIIEHAEMAKSALRSTKIFVENSFLFLHINGYADIAKKFIAAKPITKK